jgi:hypothetical protein
LNSPFSKLDNAPTHKMQVIDRKEVKVHKGTDSLKQGGLGSIQRARYRNGDVALKTCLLSEDINQQQLQNEYLIMYVALYFE